MDLDKPIMVNAGYGAPQQPPMVLQAQPVMMSGMVQQQQVQQPMMQQPMMQQPIQGMVQQQQMQQPMMQQPMMMQPGMMVQPMMQTGGPNWITNEDLCQDGCGVYTACGERFPIYIIPPSLFIPGVYMYI